MSRTTRRRANRSDRIAVVVGIVVAGLLGIGVTVPAIAADSAPLARAAGVEVVDIDGGSLIDPTPTVAWHDGPAATADAAGTGDVLKLNTTRTSGLHVSAGPDSAEATIASGTFTLRDRPAVTFTDLRATCSPHGEQSVTFGQLAIGGTDVTAAASGHLGWSTDLPPSVYGATKVIVGSTTTDGDGSITTVGLRIEAEAGASEIWRIRAGSVTCAGAAAWPTPTPTPTPGGGSGAPGGAGTAAGRSVSGVTVTAPDGTVLIDGQPTVRGTGTRTVATARASDGSPSVATGVTVSSDDAGGSDVAVSSFRQLPGAPTDPLAEYRWTALRIAGLHAHVDTSGAMTVTFDDTADAVFANGIWVNTSTDVYTGLAPDGTPRVRIDFGERVRHDDGSVTLTALHYRDLTGEYPDVRLGVVSIPAQHSGGTTPTPTPTPTSTPTATPGDGGVGTWSAYGVRTTGPSDVSPRPLVGPAAGTAATDSTTALVGDGTLGQVSASDAEVHSTRDRGEARLAHLVLYPGTRAAVDLRDVHVVVTPSATVVTTAGGSVAGTRVAAGAVAAGTRITVPDGTGTFVLNDQQTGPRSLTVRALRFTDVAGLGADVTAAVVTTEHVRADPGGTPGSGGPTGGGPAGGADRSPGALSGDGSSPTGTSGSHARGLAFTGASVGAGTIAAAVLLGAGGLVLTVRHRRRLDERSAPTPVRTGRAGAR